MTGGFQVGPFQTNFQQQGIGLAEEVPGIGLSAPIDIVLQPREIANYRQQVIDIRAYRPAPRIDRSELKEMMQMYAQWKRAA